MYGTFVKLNDFEMGLITLNIIIIIIEVKKIKNKRFIKLLSYSIVSYLMN